MFAFFKLGGGRLPAAGLETRAHPANSRGSFRAAVGSLPPSPLIGAAGEIAEGLGLVLPALEWRHLGLEPGSAAGLPRVGGNRAALVAGLGLVLETGQTDRQRQ